MPVQKTPAADVKRRYPLYAEAGLALALGAVVLAFTVPAPAQEPTRFVEPEDDPIVFVNVDPTVQEAPPPPPPPAPPPPVEVRDDVEVDDVLDAVDLELQVPAAPPAAAPMRQPAEAPRPLDLTPPALDPPPPPVAPEDDPDRVFVLVQQEPVLIGGIAALQSAVEYPEFARRTGIEGRVIVQFVVDERGNVVTPVVVRSPHDLLSQAALDAVQRVSFEPGQQRGRPVKVQFTVPVTFRLR